MKSVLYQKNSEKNNSTSLCENLNTKSLQQPLPVVPVSTSASTSVASPPTFISNIDLATIYQDILNV